jgi:hypothetical protein
LLQNFNLYNRIPTDYMKRCIYLFLFICTVTASYAGERGTASNPGPLRKLGQKIFNSPSVDNQARRSAARTLAPGCTNGVCVYSRQTTETRVVPQYHEIRYVPGEPVVTVTGDPNPKATAEERIVQGTHTITYVEGDPEIIERPMPEVEHTSETKIVRGTHTITYVEGDPEIIEEPMPQVRNTVEERVVQGTHAIRYAQAPPTVVYETVPAAAPVHRVAQSSVHCLKPYTGRPYYYVPTDDAIAQWQVLSTRCRCVSVTPSCTHGHGQHRVPTTVSWGNAPVGW